MIFMNLEIIGVNARWYDTYKHCILWYLCIYELLGLISGGGIPVNIEYYDIYEFMNYWLMSVVVDSQSLYIAIFMNSWIIMVIQYCIYQYVVLMILRLYFVYFVYILCIVCIVYIVYIMCCWYFVYILKSLLNI